jgi:hypothetical protein
MVAKPFICYCCRPFHTNESGILFIYFKAFSFLHFHVYLHQLTTNLKVCQHIRGHHPFINSHSNINHNIGRLGQSMNILQNHLSFHRVECCSGSSLLRSFIGWPFRLRFSLFATLLYYQLLPSSIVHVAV